MDGVERSFRGVKRQIFQSQFNLEKDPTNLKNIELESIENSALMKGASDFLCDSQSEKSQLMNEVRKQGDLRVAEKHPESAEPKVENPQLA